jgi:hypothetical protein
MLLWFGGPVAVAFFLGALWGLLVAAGAVDVEIINGELLGPAGALFAALIYGLIGFTGWAVYRNRYWSRPLLLWLPIPVTACLAAIAYSENLNVSAAVLEYTLTTVVPSMAILYWYLYRKENVVAYYQRLQ